MSGTASDWGVFARRGLILTGVLLIAMLVLSPVAYRLSGYAGLRGLGYAVLLCMVPGWLVFATAMRYGTSAPVATMSMGMLGRMAVAFVGLLVVHSYDPEMGLTSFGVWLGVMYLLSLAVETKLMFSPSSSGVPSDQVH